MKTAIIGGGAAGFFCAVNLAEMMPKADITIFERQARPLRKVEISGGGRCNCTNTFEGVTDLQHVYPRGARLMGRLFRQFSPQDAYRWFESHGVPLTVQPDHCVFPAAQDSHAIIDCFMRETRRHGIHIMTSTPIGDPSSLLPDFDNIVVTTGGQPKMGVPSLFTFRIDDTALQACMGIVVPNVTASIPGTKMRATGPLLITHWGMSGPVILRLSSYAARHLAEHNYTAPLAINWTGVTDTEVVRKDVEDTLLQNKSRQLVNLKLYNLQSHLWHYLLGKLGLTERRASEVGSKQLNRLINLLTNDTYTISGRSPYRDEFVTCGGIPLTKIEPTTLESRAKPHIYYAGEVLDIDGITGGFNFQAAWTTAYVVAQAISRQQTKP